MLTLAVETSCLTASCAIVQDNRVIAEISTNHGKTHSQKIMPMINTTLSAVGKELNDVDLFAASIGPGSFTGIRIGVVTIKALAYSLKRPVCGVSTLDALAFTMPDFNGVISPMLDARNNQVYSAFYRKTDNALERLYEESGIKIEDWIEQAQTFGEGILVLGDAFELHYDRLKSELGSLLNNSPQSNIFPRASATALLAEKSYRDNRSISPFELKPLYVRKSQAERMKDKPKSDDKR